MKSAGRQRRRRPDIYESGLPDGSADFERSRTLTCIAKSEAPLVPSWQSAFWGRLLAEASMPSLFHERAAPCLDNLGGELRDAPVENRSILDMIIYGRPDRAGAARRLS